MVGGPTGELKTTPVSDDANWRCRIKSEAASAKLFNQQFGFLTEHEPQAHRPYARSVGKYAGPGGDGKLLVKTLKAPASEDQMQKMAASQSLDMTTNGSPTTAFGSVMLNHTRRLEVVVTTPMELETTHKKHFSPRESLEKFGVADFGIRRTRTKLPSN